MNRPFAVRSLRRMKQAVYSKPTKIDHPISGRRIPLHRHPRFGRYDEKDSLEHVEYARQKVLTNFSLKQLFKNSLFQNLSFFKNAVFRKLIISKGITRKNTGAMGTT